MNTVNYTDKTETYFSHTRQDILSLVPKIASQKVLEIGAAGGNTLVAIKERGLASEVMGVELKEIPGSQQASPLINKFQIADIENSGIDAPNEYFDVVICADVIEHLSDPWASLKKISSHLKKGGTMILSIPNIRHWRILKKLVFSGDFRYTDEGGIMDKTHLRFFCKRNIRELVETSGLQITSILPNFLVREHVKGRKTRMINKFTLGAFENFLAVQYLVLAKKN